MFNANFNEEGHGSGYHSHHSQLHRLHHSDHVPGEFVAFDSVNTSIPMGSSSGFEAGGSNLVLEEVDFASAFSNPQSPSALPPPTLVDEIGEDLADKIVSDDIFAEPSTTVDFGECRADDW